MIVFCHFRRKLQFYNLKKLISYSLYSFFPYCSKWTSFFFLFVKLILFTMQVRPHASRNTHKHAFKKVLGGVRKKHFFTCLLQTRKKTHFGQNTRMQETKVTPILNNTSCILVILTMREKTCNYRTSLAKDPTFILISPLKMRI